MNPDKYPPYQPFNETVTNFIDERVKRLSDELSTYTSELAWDAVYNMDGVTEYIAQDLIEALVWQYLKLVGVRYEMYEDNMPVPTVFYEIRWSHGDGNVVSTKVFGDFERNIPLVMTNLDHALNLMVRNTDNVTLANHRDKTNVLVNWRATVNEAVGYGNLPAWAVVHAWGIDRGVWR